jgi:hypothetical protein
MTAKTLPITPPTPPIAPFRPSNLLAVCGSFMAVNANTQHSSLIAYQVGTASHWSSN